MPLTREMSPQEQIVDHRAKLATEINYLRRTANQSNGLTTPEIILALRHLEDARMRLGVALAREKGEDPFRDREPEIAAEA